MGLYKTSNTFQSKTGLSKDRYVTSFYFHGPDSPSDTTLADLHGVVEVFWNVASSPSTATLMSYYSQTIGPVATIKTYLATAAPHSPPIWETTWTPGAVGANPPLPSEVAMCMSFEADPIAGVPKARLQGRIYLGPLDFSVLDSDAPTDTSRPSSTFRAAVRNSGRHLYANVRAIGAGLGGWTWVIHSPTIGGGAYNEVTKVGTDDAWDIQRRRGAAPSVRDVVAIP